MSIFPTLLTFLPENWISVPERNRHPYLERLQTGLDEAKPSSDDTKLRYDGFRSYTHTVIWWGVGLLGENGQGRKGGSDGSVTKMRLWTLSGPSLVPNKWIHVRYASSISIEHVA